VQQRTPIANGIDDSEVVQHARQDQRNDVNLMWRCHPKFPLQAGPPTWRSAPGRLGSPRKRRGSLDAVERHPVSHESDCRIYGPHLSWFLATPSRPELHPRPVGPSSEHLSEAP